MNFIYVTKDNALRIIRAVVTTIVLFFISPIFSWGQEALKVINAHGIELRAESADPEISEEFYSEGKLPEFPGGMEELAAFVNWNIDYPRSAIEDEIQGTVLLEFTVDTNGRIINAKIKNSVRRDLDNECLSMLKRMPVWVQGQLNGKAVAVKFFWPIKFVLKEASDHWNHWSD